MMTCYDAGVKRYNTDDRLSFNVIPTSKKDR